MAAKTGGLFTSVTVIVKDLESPSGGDPSSVMRTGMVVVLGPCASDGVQVNRPEPGLIEAPAGAPRSKLKVRVWAGTSGSEAAALNETSVPSATVRLVMAASTGGLFDSRTTAVKV